MENRLDEKKKITNYNNNIALKKKTGRALIVLLELLNSGKIGLISYYTENYRK